MNLSSLSLLFVAAILHALANVFLKRARDKLAFTWWMLGLTSIVGLPVWMFVGDIGPEGWCLVVLSGILEAAYFFTLCRAYTYGDLSQVYPIARGSAPLFIVCWATIFLGERPSVGGLIGVALIIGGLYLVNLPRFADWKKPVSGIRTLATRWALLTGLLISAYMTVDKIGVQYVDPTIYLYLVLFVAWIALTPLCLTAGQRPFLVAEIRPNPTQNKFEAPGSVVAAALFGIVAYALVLVALRMSNVGYVGAVREVSVILGAWIGVRFMGEAGGSLRVVAAASIVAGVILIALVG